MTNIFRYDKIKKVRSVAVLRGVVFLEFIIVTALIIFLLFLLGFSFGQITALFFGVLGIVIVLIGMFFAFCLVLLAASKKEKAVFAEFDKSSKFPFAVYDIKGEKRKNLFPSEMVMREKLYVPHKSVYVRLCGLRKTVIDKNAFLTIVVGSAIFIPAAIFSVIQTAGIISSIQL